MAALTVCSSPQNCSDSGAQENKLCHRLHRSPRICHEVVALATKTSLQGPGWVSRAQVSTASGAGRAQRSEGAGVRGAAHSWGHSGGAQRPPPSPVGEGPTGGAASRRTFSPSAHSESSRCCPWGGRWGRGQGAQTADDGPSCEHHRGARGEDSGEGDKALRLWTTGPHCLDVRASSWEQRWVKLSGWDGNTSSGLSRWWGGAARPLAQPASLGFPLFRLPPTEFL